MIGSRMKRALGRSWSRFSRTPFGTLVKVFVGRMFHGGDKSASGDLDLGPGVMVSLMAMPGLLVSLLTFEKYGSLMRFLNGSGQFDPFTATIPDEYFFIVLSLAVSAGAAVWHWDAIFLDRRDHTNLVPLPIKLRSIFLANLGAILIVTGLYTVVANAASVFLFPIAVAGSQASFTVFLRFAAGHFTAVISASTFGCFAVFALSGLLMTLLPAELFRKISHLARFAAAIILFGLVVSSFAVPDLLQRMSPTDSQRLMLLPPLSFLGVARTVWGRGTEAFVPEMLRAALAAISLAAFIAIAAYAASLRRSFLRIPELPEAGPLPHTGTFRSPLAFALSAVLGDGLRRACYQFVMRTLVRSESHLQILGGFMALGLVLSASALSSATNLHTMVGGKLPSADALSVPFILSFCVVVGIRFAFAIPADLRANWVFQFWLDREGKAARNTARYALLTLSLALLVPACFVATLAFWGWTVALLHTAIVIISTAVLAEVCLLRFRKFPFTCSHPSFRSHSGLVAVAYLFGFLFFTGYLVEIERWALIEPWRALCFVPLWGAVLGGIHYYRNQMLGMDRELVFEELPTSAL
jgi:hypothetical protein